MLNNDENDNIIVNKNVNNVLNKSISIQTPIKKPTKIINNKQSTSFIHEIKTDNLTADQLKQKRSIMIIIRQFCNTFDLKKIYGNNKDKFISNLIKLNNDQLNCILEQIKCELAIQRNGNIFNNVIETGAISFEQILDKIFKIDV